jgi:hypothetical protein
MCHGYADLRYLKREAEERMNETVRERTPAPAPAAEPAGGLVAVLRGLFEKVRPAKTTVAAK